jgi:aminobenzoyl-glutamate utilization protein B
MMRYTLLISALGLASQQLTAQASQPNAAATSLISAIDAKRDSYADVAKRIWEFAEVGYQETRSSALLQEQLSSAGFSVSAGVAEIPTAFVATYGSGKPVIGIIGEFDALPGLSQAAVPERKPLDPNGAGHACGHHLFGTGSVAAAIAVKDWMKANNIRGTLKVFGTPAEEGGAGKVFMLRAGLFSDVDIAVAWHPGDDNSASMSSTLANVSAKFRFRGVSAHAAGAPERGRSALDGVEAMNIMVNLMREHVPDETRIHYVITNGGRAPNVVPDFAEVYYVARHGDMRVLDGIWERILNAASGAPPRTNTKKDL